MHRFERVIALAFLILQPVIFYRDVVVRPTRHIPYDIDGFHTPLAEFAASALREGRLPMWDPYPYCGYPIHGDLQAQIFYPPAWLAFAARMISRPDSMLYWLEWLVVLHPCRGQPGGGSLNTFTFEHAL